MENALEILSLPGLIVVIVILTIWAMWDDARQRRKHLLAPPETPEPERPPPDVRRR